MESRYQPSESDIRAVVTKRKVSGGTVSEKGRTACDVMLGLAKTCAKLKISFFYHLSASKSRDPKSPLSHASSPPFQADHHAASEPAGAGVFTTTVSSIVSLSSSRS